VRPDGWGGITPRKMYKGMNELDVVRVKNTVRAEEMVYGSDVAGWEGTIVADADTATPIVEFNDYGPSSILVNLDAANLEVVRTVR
jgi:hypothetical protein